MSERSPCSRGGSEEAEGGVKNEIYTSLVIAEDDEDIDGPITDVIVTEEANLFAIWKSVADRTPELVKWFRDYERNLAIEYAVDFGRRLRLELTKPRATMRKATR